MTPGEKIQRMNENITNLKRKKLLPSQTMGYWSQDLKNLTNLVHQTEMQAFKEWVCPECMISVYGPKKMMLEHHKIHAEKKEIRENEVFQKGYKLYR